MDLITMKSVIVRKNEILASDMDGETVMMHTETGKYYNLGTTGGAIWNMLAEPLQVERLINNLIEKFNVTKEQCEQDVLPFLQQIYQNGLIKICID